MKLVFTFCNSLLVTSRIDVCIIKPVIFVHVILLNLITPTSWTPCSTLIQIQNSLAWNWECSCFNVHYRLSPLKKNDKILLKVHRYSNVDVCSKNLVVRYQCTLGTGKTKQHFVLFIPISKREEVNSLSKNNFIINNTCMTSFICAADRTFTN